MTATLEPITEGWVNPNVKGYNPAKRKRCVNVYWTRGRRVRILDCPFGYAGKLGTISDVGEKFVYVCIKLGRKPGEHTTIAYPPKNVRLT